MNVSLLIIFVLAILGGIFHGFIETVKVSQGLSTGVKPSKNLFTYLFVDKY